MSWRSSSGRLASSGVAAVGEGAAVALWGAFAPDASGVGACAANAAKSSSGSHRRPEYSTMRVGSAETRPRACLAFEGKFGVPAHPIGLRDDACIAVGAGRGADCVADLFALLGRDGPVEEVAR